MFEEKKEDKYFIYDHPKKKGLAYLFKFILFKLESAFYRAIFFLVKRDKRKTKYKVALCAIFKNESIYLKEWLEFHIIVGVEHFYLYNNNSDDDYMKVLKPYLDSGIVTLINFPYEHSQNKAYADCIKKYRNETEWIGFIDMDEFVVPVLNNNLYDFLKKFKKRPAVKIYWRLFGTSGIINRDVSNLVTQDFKIAWPKYDEVGKCFYNTAFDADTNSKKMQSMHHVFFGKWHNIEIPPVNCFDNISLHGFEKVKGEVFPIQINHYFTKSYNEYFKIKVSRGDVYYANDPKKDVSYFFRHEMLCTREDDKINKYMVKLKLAMNYTKSGDKKGAK